MKSGRAACEEGRVVPSVSVLADARMFRRRNVGVAGDAATHSHQMAISNASSLDAFIPDPRLTNGRKQVVHRSASIAAIVD